MSFCFHFSEREFTMKKFGNMVCSVLLVSGLLAASPASAATVTVLNPSFENPDVGTIGVADDWVQTGGGVLNEAFTGGHTPGHFTAPDGVQVAWGNSGATASQILTETLTAGTTYQLTVAVGARDDTSGGSYDIQLLANGDVLGNVTGSLSIGDLFSDVTFSYMATGADTQLGQSLQIVLRTTGTQMLYDNVRLTSTVIPEPSAFALMTLGCLGATLVRRRRVLV